MIYELKREDAAPGVWYPITRAPKDYALLLFVRGSTTELGHYNTALAQWVANWDGRPLTEVTHFQFIPEHPKPQ